MIVKHCRPIRTEKRCIVIRKNKAAAEKRYWTVRGLSHNGK
jgi:hypothetical protein